MDPAGPFRPNTQQHTATVHHSGEQHQQYGHSMVNSGSSRCAAGPSTSALRSCRFGSSSSGHHSHHSAAQQQHPHQAAQHHHRPSQAQSFDDSHLLHQARPRVAHDYHLQYPTSEPYPQASNLYGTSLSEEMYRTQGYPPSMPQMYFNSLANSAPATSTAANTNHAHVNTSSNNHASRRRRHSSTPRLKSVPASAPGPKGNNNFIASITNNFMSFGAPFLFDWRLFCERGQPRYVHKHDGDGLRVDECEARFLSKIADEEKASLNAISDDDDHSTSANKYHQKSKNKSTGTAAANVECLGSVRKSGFLSVKKWLIRKKTSLELARKRGWKGYWVCLKGTTLLFYRCDCGDDKSGGHVIEARPRHLIFVDACLVQAIPEHPKRDYVFCLSTAFGDAYLLDAPCLVERDHWIAAIHCACAAQLARSSGRVTVSHVLHKEIKRLDEAVELDNRARTEAEQIISTAIAAGSLTAAEAKSKQQQLLTQIHQLEEKIEKNRTEIFRFRAYLAALISDEDPNPKTLLSQTTKRSKLQLNRLGVFTVSSLHAFNCAKNPTIIGNITRSRSTEDNFGHHGASTSEQLYGQSSKSLSGMTAAHPGSSKEVRVSVVVKMLNNELNKFEFNATLSADQVLGKLIPAPVNREYYLRHLDDMNVVFKRHETVLDHGNATLEIVPKHMFTCEMTRDSNEVLFGFSVESELCQDDLRVYVSRVEPNSLAVLHSLRRSDEIVVINGALVQDLDMMYVESVLQEELALCLTIRAAREEGALSSRPNSRCAIANMTWSIPGASATNYSDYADMPTTDDLIESLVCPPPPPIDVNQMILSEKQLSKYIVPKVDNYLLSPSGEASNSGKYRSEGTALPYSETLGRGSSATRSMSSKSAKSLRSQSEHVEARPHSAAAGSYRSGASTSGAHHHSGHHHHVPKSHHHHHYHHHRSTKHIYHIADPQTHLYGLLEQHLLGTGPIQPGTTQGCDEQVEPGGASAHLTSATDTSAQIEQSLASLGSNGASSVPQDTEPQQRVSDSQSEPVPLPEQASREISEPASEINQPLSQTDQTGVSLVPLPQEESQSFGPTEITNDKLRKVVHELVDTEITYCQALDQLMTLYLDPLLKSCTLTNLDARKLVGAIPQVIITQNQFREDLTTIINNDELNIEGIAKIFLNYCNDFKNYSTFCASHTKATKLLSDEKSILHDWLTKQSKSAKHPNMYSLESFLIRPIQRILKYPLLLAQLKTLCPKDSQPFFKMNEALRAIESVAEHINEMQRINEEYGSIFESLVSSTKSNSKKSIVFHYDLTPISLIHYGGVDWINSIEFLGKSHKSTSKSGGIHLHSMCFVFKQCVVFLCKETIRHGKSKKQSSASTSDVEIIRHQVLIPVSQLTVRACPPSELDLDFKWELIQLKSNAQGKRSEKIFRLSNSTNEYRNAFLRTIRQIIREDVRRMDVISSRPATTRSETSPTAKKSDKSRHMVSFASTQNLTKLDHQQSGKQSSKSDKKLDTMSCGYCGEDFRKLMKKGNS